MSTTGVNPFPAPLQLITPFGGTPISVAIGASNVQGSSGRAARVDHSHRLIDYWPQAFDLTVAGDEDVFTVPVAPAGFGRFILTRCILRLDVALTGAGNVTVRVGSTLGGNEVVLDTVINNATATGVVAGEAIATLGADMLATQGYEAVYAAGQVLRIRKTVVAPVADAILFTYVFGELLP